MIKINLLRALKESGASLGDRGNAEPAGDNFLTRLFGSKQDDGDIDSEEDSSGSLEIAAKIFIMIMIVGGLFYYESTNIPMLQGELAEQSAKLQELIEYNNKSAASVAEIKRLQENKVLIEKQIASLDGLSKVRLKYIKALDLIQTNIPDKMWFNMLKSKDNILEATGISFSETEISKFLDLMGRSVYFSDVSMLSSEDVVGKEGETKKFKRFNLNFVLEANK